MQITYTILAALALTTAGAAAPPKCKPQYIFYDYGCIKIRCNTKHTGQVIKTTKAIDVIDCANNCYDSNFTGGYCDEAGFDRKTGTCTYFKAPPRGSNVKSNRYDYAQYGGSYDDNAELKCPDPPF